MQSLTVIFSFNLLILCLNSLLTLCSNSLESIPRFQLEDLQLDPENLSENFVRTQNGWSYGAEHLKNEQLSILPGYMREFIGMESFCSASRSCNLNRSDVDELAERVFILQSEIPELSVDLSWYKVCAFSVSIIDTKKSFIGHCKSIGVSILLSRPVTKLLEQSIIRLCRSLPQYSTCNGVDLTLDSLTEELISATVPHLLPIAKRSLPFTHFCFVSSRSIRARTREEYLVVCQDSILLLNSHEMSGFQITPSVADQICKSTWIYNTECNGFSNTKLISDIAFEIFTLIRKEGIPSIDINNVCQFLTKISHTLRITSDSKTLISTRKRYLYECTMHLTPMIEYEKSNNSENRYGFKDQFYSRAEIVNYFHDIATSICTSVSFYKKKHKRKIFIPGFKKKKVVEKRQSESVLELFMNLMHSVKATSRRILGWSIELPFPGSDESKAMLMLGYSLNTADVGSIQNPQYIRMLAILHSKRYILPKTAYDIWRDSVSSIGIEILPPFTPSLTPGIISRPEKDVVDLKLNCGSNNEDVDALALELLSVSHENNLVHLKFTQFCKPSEALIGVRSEDFYSSCIEALKYLPELDIHTGKVTGRYLTIPFVKISKICKDTPRWESTSSGLSYASLVVQDNLSRKDELNKSLKSYSKSNVLTDRDIYSYVIKTAARSALERTAANDQICKKLKPIFSEEDVNFQYDTQFDLENIQHAANVLFKKAVSLLDYDKHLAFLLSGNTARGLSPVTFEAFCSLVLALSKVEKKYFNSECARNLRLMFRQKVSINGHLKLATIKSRTITKICMSSPQFEKCGNYPNGEVDEISYDILLSAQKFRFTSITYRHICNVVKNIRRGEIKSLIPKGQKNNTNISSFFNSDCIYGLRTLSIGARHAEIICSATRFWVMCGNYLDSEVDALASQLYSEVVQNTGLARFVTVSLFELVDFCPIAEALIHEVDVRFFNRECVNALAAMSISKEYGKSICQSSRHWQGTCIGTIDEHSSIIELIDPIAGALFKSSQDLGYLDLFFPDFCDSAKEIFSIKEVTETGKILEGHETSMFHVDCPKIISSMLHSLSEERSIGMAKFKMSSRAIKSVSSENFEKAEMICQNFFNHYDPNYGVSQVEEYDEVDFRRGALEKNNIRNFGNVNKISQFGRSINQRMAGNNQSVEYRYNWANLIGRKYFIPDNRNVNNIYEKPTNHIDNQESGKTSYYKPYRVDSKAFGLKTGFQAEEDN